MTDYRQNLNLSLTAPEMEGADTAEAIEAKFIELFSQTAEKMEFYFGQMAEIAEHDIDADAATRFHAAMNHVDALSITPKRILTYFALLLEKGTLPFDEIQPLEDLIIDARRDINSSIITFSNNGKSIHYIVL